MAANARQFWIKKFFIPGYQGCGVLGAGKGLAKIS